MPFQATFIDKVTVMLRHYREAAGLSQAEIAEILKIGVRSYQRYESGESIPSVDLIFSLSQALKFELKDFFAPHEAITSFRGFKLYDKEEYSNFTNSSLVLESEILGFFNSETYRKIVKGGELKAIKEIPFFKNSSFPLALSNPKNTIVNPRAREIVGLHTDIVPTTSLHPNIRMLGMMWSTLMDSEISYYELRWNGQFPKGKFRINTKSIFTHQNRNYLALSAVKIEKV